MKLTLEQFQELIGELGILMGRLDTERLFEALRPKETTRDFIAAYCDGFKTRYKTNPVIDGIASSTAKRLVNDIGAATAIGLVETYLSMGDAFYVGRRHDLLTFARNLNAIKVFEESKKSITQTELRQMDRREANANVFGDLLEEKRHAETPE